MARRRAVKKLQITVVAKQIGGDCRVRRGAITPKLNETAGVGDIGLARRCTVLKAHVPIVVDDSGSGGGAVLECCGATERERGAGAVSDGEAGAVEGDYYSVRIERIGTGTRRQRDAAESGIRRECDVPVGRIRIADERRGPVGDLTADPVPVKVEIFTGDSGPRRVDRVG